MLTNSAEQQYFLSSTTFAHKPEDKCIDLMTHYKPAFSLIALFLFSLALTDGTLQGKKAHEIDICWEFYFTMDAGMGVSPVRFRNSLPPPFIERVTDMKVS